MPDSRNRHRYGTQYTQDGFQQERLQQLCALEYVPLHDDTEDEVLSRANAIAILSTSAGDTEYYIRTLCSGSTTVCSR